MREKRSSYVKQRRRFSKIVEGRLCEDCKKVCNKFEFICCRECPEPCEEPCHYAIV